MKTLNASNILYVFGDLTLVETVAKGANVSWKRDAVTGQLHRLRDHLVELNLPVSLAAANRFIQMMEDGYRDADQRHNRKSAFGQWLSGENRSLNVDRVKVAKLAAHLKDSIAGELWALKILIVEPSARDLLDASRPPFGADVAAKLPSTSYDIAEAAKCLALESFTACVFHLMRALEAGVQLFGAKLGIALTSTKGRDKTWHNITEEIDAVIRKSPVDATTKKYAAVSSNLYNVRLAWRNETMHPNQTYNAEQAGQVFIASRAFLQELAAIL